MSEIEGKKDLAEQLRAHLNKTGALTSADVAHFVKQTAPDQPAEPTGDELDRDTELPPVDPAKMDAANKAAENQPPTDIHNSGMTGPALEEAKKRVKITAADKEAFIRAAITGERMRSEFLVLGGKLKIVVRNRTLPETRAIIAEIRHALASDAEMTNLDYTVRLRSMLMAAQIEEMNGIAHPTIDSETPLRRTQAKDGVVPPGWLPHADNWAALNEGVHGVVWQCIWEFETKYWTMVEDAKNQDFWLPEAST